jgi:transcriptional regulator of heat shock response
MLKDRSHDILEAAMRDFLRTGFPITSERLFERFDFGIKPAMIRWELQDLADSGYFYQTRPSGGRLPTNKAYRFFVDELLDEEPGTDADTRALARELEHGRMKRFIEDVASYLSVFGVGYDAGEDEVYESGLRRLLDHLPVEDKEGLLDVVRDIELLPERLARFRESARMGDAWPRVFIGESPVTKSEHLSVIAGEFGSGDERFLLMAIGPKRMDYRKSLNLFRELRASFEE